MPGSRYIFIKSYFKGFSGTHSDLKMRLCKVSIFLLVKNCFSKFSKFFTTECLEDQKVFL